MVPYRNQFRRESLCESERSLLLRLANRLSFVPEKYQQFIDKVLEREEGCSDEFEEAIFAYDFFFSQCFSEDLDYNNRTTRISEVVEDLLQQQGGFQLAGDYLKRRFTGLQPSLCGLTSNLLGKGIDSRTYKKVLEWGVKTECGEGSSSVKPILSSISDPDVHAKAIKLFTACGLYDPYFDEE